MRGIGIDIEEVEKVAHKCQKQAFLDLVFTPDEQAYCREKADPAQSFAARFAAKEAFMKAVGKGWTESTQFADIEVIHVDSGQPRLVLHGEARIFFEKEGYANVLLTLSHTPLTAVAVVVVI